MRRSSSRRSSSSAVKRPPRPPRDPREEVYDSDFVDWPEESSEEPVAGRRRKPLRWIKKKARAHLTMLSQLEALRFVLAVGIWTLLLKPVLMAISGLVELRLLPEVLTPLLSFRPIEWLAGATAGAMGIAFSGWEGALVGNLVCLGLLLPLVTTALAQLLPLHLLRERIPKRWLVVTISLVLMGILYTLAFGRLGFFLTGVGLGLPLLWAFEVQVRQRSATKAFFMTAGVHAFANTCIVLFLVQMGAL